MAIAVVVCASICTALLVAWLVVDLARGKPALVDRLCGATFVALAFTSCVVLRYLIVTPSGRGPRPLFVFMGAPIGFYLAWLAFKLARERAPRG